VRRKLERIAATELEADPEDLAIDDGECHVAGAPGRSVPVAELAGIAHSRRRVEGVDAGLEETTFYEPDGTAYTFGTHVAVVAVDPDSGEVGVERYLAVDDCGERINPRIVEGQVHGGVAQGLGQALYERAEYDDNGQLVTGSLQDYAAPKATQVPGLETDHTVTPSPTNPLGVKGIGEAGTIAAPPAVVNAVVDALGEFGVDHLDMPLTAERVWRVASGTE
jgi:carbon-monoxide dehydrogenase large subunit